MTGNPSRPSFCVSSGVLAGREDLGVVPDGQRSHLREHPRGQPG